MEEKTNKLFTFDNFIEGPSNKFACSAAKAIADCPFITNRTFNYNPLVIYGGTGLGKTHLLQAIKQEVNSKFPELNVSYIKAEEYAYEHITSLANKTVNEFQNKYKKQIWKPSVITSPVPPVLTPYPITPRPLIISPGICSLSVGKIFVLCCRLSVWFPTTEMFSGT